MVELFAFFDSVIRDHLSRVASSQQRVHYFGLRIQNELILLKIKTEIINMLQRAKYYSIVLNYITDCSHKMSIKVRFVCKTDGIIHEQFLRFVEFNF